MAEVQSALTSLKVNPRLVEVPHIFTGERGGCFVRVFVEAIQEDVVDHGKFRDLVSVPQKPWL